MSNKYPGGIITSGAAAGYSVFFDGTGDYLTWSGSTVGTAAYTFECWFNVSSFTASPDNQICLIGPDSTVNGGLNINITSSTNVNIDRYGVSADSYTVATMSLNTWNHIAVVRNASGVTTVFLNGVRSSTGTRTDTYNYGNVKSLGRASSGATRYFPGYMANARYVTAAVYDPTQTTINVPTQLFNITNTQLLTCNSPAIVDQSSNAFAITSYGDAKVSTFTPFTGYTAYNPALGASTPGIWSVSDAIQARQTRRWNMYDPYFQNTTLLLHGNGTNGAQNNTFLDSSSNNFSITRNGNTTQGTFSPFSQTGWSNNGNGTNSYLSTPYNANLLLNGVDSTIECWLYLNATPGGPGSTQPIIVQGTGFVGGVYAANWAFFADSSGLNFYGPGASAATIPLASVPINQWFHVAAVVTAGTSVTLYLNGVSTATASITAIGNNTGYANNIMGNFSTGGGGGTNNFLNGYISNLRVVKGSRVYTSNFTPSTTPLTAISGTALLTCQSNRFIDNSTNAFAITVNGTPSVQAFSPFYPVVAYTPETIGGSGYFDGSGDYLTKSNINFSTNAFTIEGWFYVTSSAANVNYWGQDNGGGTNPKMLLYGDNSGNFVFETGSVSGAVISVSRTTYIKVNAWQHIVIARGGTGTNQTAMFIDGVRVGTGTCASLSAITAAFNLGYIGEAFGVTFNGYVSGFRIVNGTDVYGYSNTTITVPTAPPTNITNTNTLLNFTNGGIIDATAKNVLETVGNAQISTAQSKWGGSSILFDNVDDWLYTVNPVVPATGQFTIEAWIYLNSTTDELIWSQFTNAAADRSSLRVTSGKLVFYNINTSNVSSTNNVSTGTWVHIAVTRDSSNNLRLFINGNVEATSASYTYSIQQTRATFGAFYDNSSDFDGYMDDIRVTAGYARYTANFTPQTSQWQDQ